MTPETAIYPALTTLIALFLYFWMGLRVGQARAKYGVKAPAIAGHPDFERVMRVQVNTLEWLPLFLPSLWLFAWFVDASAAAAIGLVWVAGRYLFMTGYTEAAEKRSLGFGVQALAVGVLWLGALVGIFVVAAT